MNDAFAARNAAGVDDAAVLQLLIHPHVELRLARAAILERDSKRSSRVERIERSANEFTWPTRIGDARDLADWTWQRIGVEVSGTHAVRPPIVRGMRRGDIGAVRRPIAPACG